MAYILVFLSYLIGSIPFGLVFGKCLGVDVRSAGSGNIGATNVQRLLGKKIGVMTLMADALKAVVPMVGTSWLLRGQPHLSWFVVLSGGMAFLGHLYPVYLRFKGGKGVATALGVFLYLAPLAVLGAALLFVLVVALSGYVSLGSLSAAAALPVLLWLMDAPREVFLLAIFVCALIWIQHRQNIGRLMRHEENSLKSKKVSVGEDS